MPPVLINRESIDERDISERWVIMIKLNGKILEVLCMVYHYKHYRSAMASLYPEQKINWYEDTKKILL